MTSIIKSIDNWIKELISGNIIGNIERMLEDINGVIQKISDNVGQTPQSWKSEVFNNLKNLSETVMIPVAGLVISAIACHELIRMTTDKNHMKDFEISSFLMWTAKVSISIILVTHAFEIIMGIFDLGQHIVNESVGVLVSNSPTDARKIAANLNKALEDKSNATLILMLIESWVVRLAVFAFSIVIPVICWGRMIEMLIYASVAPLPLATLTSSSHNVSSIGQNYLKSLAGLALQGFFMFVCVAIYQGLIKSVGTGGTEYEDVFNDILSCFGYTILLVMSLMKTGSLSKSILGAH